MKCLLCGHVDKSINIGLLNYECDNCGFFERYVHGTETEIGCYGGNSITVSHDEDWGRLHQRLKKMLWKNRKRLLRQGIIKGRGQGTFK